jgi:hypothetical protein
MNQKTKIIEVKDCVIKIDKLWDYCPFLKMDTRYNGKEAWSINYCNLKPEKEYELESNLFRLCPLQDKPNDKE